jgi:hypothetical protein
MRQIDLTLRANLTRSPVVLQQLGLKPTAQNYRGTCRKNSILGILARQPSTADLCPVTTYQYLHLKHWALLIDVSDLSRYWEDASDEFRQELYFMNVSFKKLKNFF